MVQRGVECSQYPVDYVNMKNELKPAQNLEDEAETNQFFYHPDHLGSSSFITDATGYAVQHLQYLPFGETFVDQTPATNPYDSRYTFSAKEKDDETQYSYFGARYYDSDLSVWLSVDPLSDKYPNLSPYAYCANDPVMLVDPDGRKLFIVGEAACEFMAMTSSHLKNMTVDRDEKTGNVKYMLNAGVSVSDLTEFEQTLVNSIETDKDILANVVYKSDEVLFDADVREGGGNEVDMADFSLLDGDLKKFQEAFIGHFLEERISNEDFDAAHKQGIIKETKILREKYEDIIGRSSSMAREDVQGRTVINKDGSSSQFWGLFDFGSTSGNDYSLWVELDGSINKPIRIVLSEEGLKQ